MARSDSFFNRLTKNYELTPLVSSEHRGRSGIYVIHNIENNRFYIGSAVNLYKRKHVHLAYLRKNKHHNLFLQRDFNKNKKKLHFVVIEEVSHRKELITKEQKFLDEFFVENDCYNLNPVANSFFGRKHSRKTKEKLSKKAIGRRLSQETRKKMSESHKGIPLPANHPIRNGHSTTTKERIRKAMLGSKNHFFGKHHTSQTKEKIRKKLSGRYFGIKCSVKATNVRSGEEQFFDSMAEAARKLNVGAGHISSVCSGKMKQAGGWKFVKVELNG